ncbi:MAG: ATP-binding cassette domain-containing protein [Erysipelotrichaceae bacterium]
MFEINNLKFKNILKIDHLIMDRAITCIVGTSGSGKTTLLKMLNRLYDAQEGEIFYNQKNIKEISSIQLRRQVIMLGQTPIIYPGSIEDNLQIGLIFSEKKLADKETLKSYLKKVNLDKELDDSCNKLSGGEKQRLCLARVMLMNGDVYLLDEPSSALDKETELFMIHNLIEFVLEKQKTLIMVTHSSEIASAYPHSIMKLVQGTCGGYEHE